MTTKMLSTLSVAFFLFFSLSFNSYAQSDTYEVSGKVIDEEMDAPLEFATISLVNSSDSQDVKGVVTDSRGNFSVDVPEGNYNIIVEFRSYETKKFNNRNIDYDLDMGTI